MINGLDLFSGIGGVSLALKRWVKPVAYCEIDRYAQSVLLARMSEGLLPKAPIWDDITTLRGADLPEIDMVYGGFPCQDISVAGAGAGLAGERSGLFFEICRMVKEVHPRFVFLENVPAIRTRGLREVLRALTDLGYDCRWTCVSAAEVGALHLRKRWFLLAYANGERSRNKRQNKVSQNWEMDQRKAEFANYGEKESLADSDSERLQGQSRAKGPRQEGRQQVSDECLQGRPKWSVEPDVGRVANGLPYRVDRIKGLGNAVVPAQAREAFKRLLGSEIETH